MRKKALRAVMPLLCLALCAVSVLAAGCGSKYDVSAGGANVTAEIVKNKDKTLSLRITGKGEMISWKSPSNTPWHDKADKIKTVVVSGGVTNVGANAFKEIDAEYIVLPESVQSVEEGGIGENTDVFAYSDSVTYADSDLSVYLFSETTPQKEVVYWQQDMSKGDIEISEQAAQKYWRFEGGEPTRLKRNKILFVGNSFTYRNGKASYSTGVPGVFDGVAKDLGYWTETYMVTGPGWYLKNHAKSTDVCGKQIDRLLSAYDDFDYVMLQEQSVNPFENYEDFLGGVRAMQQKINATQKNAKIYLYETWGSPFSADERKITVPAMEAKLRKAYESAAKECGLDISYVGQAFTDIYSNAKSINLYDTDNRHQGYTGAYLSGCVHVGTVLGGNVLDTKFTGAGKFDAPMLSEETLTALRTAAYNAVNSDHALPEEEEGPEPAKQYDLEVAVWGRWMTEPQTKDFFDGFKAYCKENGIAAENLHYTYYIGTSNTDPYYYIANFTGAVTSSGGADVIFPCANNLTTQEGTQIKSAEITPLGYALNGKTDRCVAKLKDGEFANAFCEYVLSEQAKAFFATA